MNKNLLPIHFAPLQGYTDAAYRQAHACIFGGIDIWGIERSVFSVIGENSRNALKIKWFSCA